MLILCSAAKLETLSISSFRVPGFRVRSTLETATRTAAAAASCNSPVESSSRRWASHRFESWFSRQKIESRRDFLARIVGAGALFAPDRDASRRANLAALRFVRCHQCQVLALDWSLTKRWRASSPSGRRCELAIPFTSPNGARPTRARKQVSHWPPASGGVSFARSCGALQTYIISACSSP